MRTNIKSFLLCLPLLFACGAEETVVEEKASAAITSVSLNKEQIQSAGITEGKPVKQLIGLTIYANGTIEVPPQNKTVISVPFGGFVKSLEVLDGMYVKTGQKLISIEHPELIQLQQDYLEVIGNIEYLEAEYERQKSLVQQDAGSMKAMQLAKSQYTAATAKKSGLKAKLDMAGVNMKQLNAGNLQRYISIDSPFDGVVTKVAVNVGAYADPMEHLLEIIDLEHAHAEVTAFEKDIKHLKIGQKVNLKFSDEDKMIEASIFLIGKEIGKDRTVKVHCHLNKENSSIAPGAYFKASIYTGASERFCIPSEAIVEMNGKNVVFFSEKESGNLTTYSPEEVTITAIESGNSAIEFKNPTRTYDNTLVLHGAYDIMSAILIQGEE
ncbi:MAG: efflux RND transporter periplasmic adaptor subunit [Crocinitomicaceae bacterium]|nr:efflux RND transporter periplasmic adaptor subunit [Crocinitomicaceae bacterium]MCF8432975.1 efflux RND transporter periplasmic adaptor subunit [Crocinitomicaceae bacterium]